MQRATPDLIPHAGFDIDANTAPFSLDAEQAVLGAILLWNDLLDDIPFLAPDHFYDPLHKQIMATVADLVRQGRLANPVTMGPIFKDAPPIDGETTVVAYLGTLGVNATSRAAAKDTARLIVDLADRRELILIAEDLRDAAQNANPEYSPKDIIEETESRLFAMAEMAEGQLSTTLTFAQASDLAVERAAAAYRGKHAGLKTGFASLDRKIDGLEPSDLVILAGRPSMGKTALATNIAFNVAKAGTPVHFFSLEMSAQQLATRVLSEQIDVSSSKVRSGRIGQGEIKKLVDRAQELSKLPLHIDEKGGTSIAQVAARARRLKRKRHTGLIVVDYLQLMQASRRRENRVQDITEITTGLKALAKELNVPIIALSQLSRATEHRESKRPQLSDLRESGSIEQDADIVMFVYREEYYVEREQPSETDVAAFSEWQAKLLKCRGKAEVIIGKARHSELGVVPLAFSGELTRFSDLWQEARHGL